jgi:predicted phage-related endonuclease
MSKVKDALCVEYGEFDVSEDRDKYIGGSDLPAILGLSKFKTRWQLLLEKAGLEERTFAGNRFTEYGHII